MAFRELAEGIEVPDGASERYRLLEALGKMLTGELYEHLKFSFEQETRPGGNEHVNTRERRPSTDFNLAYEITQDTLGELFGDEQFPMVLAWATGEQVEEGTKALSDLIEATGLDHAVSDAYEEGVIGAVGVIIHKSDNGAPFYEVIPAKWCEPVYRSKYSTELVGLIVTYPITKEQAEEILPGITKEPDNKGIETFWYRYTVDPFNQTDYRPLSSEMFKKLGEKDEKTGKIIEFIEMMVEAHGFKGRAPIAYAKNLSGKPRDIDGPCLWWPIRNICVDIDYTLSQASRGLRYGSDPMIFIRQGDMMNMLATMPGVAANQKPAGGMATVTGKGGAMVRGATQTLVGPPGSDAKVLEITAAAITEEREFVRDLREYALEVIGGQKARAEQLGSAASGTSIEKSGKPLRRLVRRQRRPYGIGLLVPLIDLTVYGFECGALNPESVDVDIKAIPEACKYVLEWPKDDTLQGQDLLYHVQAVQAMAGAPPTAPKELISPEAAGAKLAADVGFHQPYDTIKGTSEPQTPPIDPNAAIKAAAKPKSAPKKPKTKP